MSLDRSGVHYYTRLSVINGVERVLALYFWNATKYIIGIQSDSFNTRDFLEILLLENIFYYIIEIWLVFVGGSYNFS